MMNRHKQTLPLMLSLFVLSAAACNGDKLVEIEHRNENGGIAAAAMTTYGGAIGLYHGVLETRNAVIDEISQSVGEFTDELQTTRTTDIVYRDPTRLIIPTSRVYGYLHKLRTSAFLARVALSRYRDVAPPAYFGELYALQGMAEVMLAELFCSGIPLTQVLDAGTFEYTRGFSSDEVFTHAIALFDSALVHANDSVPILTLASVGKARAFLSLGHWDEARMAVAGVTSEAVYIARVNASAGVFGRSFWSMRPAEATRYRVEDRKGTNGIVWGVVNVAERDPRVPLAAGTPVRQAKFRTTPGIIDHVFASGIEARLIEAESYLQPAEMPSGPWLDRVNLARQTFVNDAGERLLPDTSDPGTAAARIDLLFHERALWLYLTGHRQGDLRRLIRQYERDPSEVYPWGQSPEGNPYATDVVFPVPDDEQKYNYLYKGCIHMEA